MEIRANEIKSCVENDKVENNSPWLTQLLNKHDHSHESFSWSDGQSDPLDNMTRMIREMVIREKVRGSVNR